MILWLVAICAELPRCFLLTSGILSAIAAIGELMVVVAVADASVVCSGDNCFASGAALTVIAVVALLLWVAVAFLSCRGYRGGSTSSLPR